MAQTRRMLGELLMEAGLIDDFKLQTALSHQRTWGGMLGNILIELEYAREEDIARVISENLKIPYANLFEPEISPDVIRLLKPEIVKKYSVVPVRIEAKNLVLAMIDPLDISIMDNIRFITNLTIKPVLSMPSEVRDAIRKYYDGEPVDRTNRISFRDGLEIERQVPAIASVDRNQPYQQQEVETLRQDVATQKVFVEALAALLIEKDLMTRDELTKFIEQRKMGV